MSELATDPRENPPHRPTKGALERFCDRIDRLNEWAGLFWGFTIIAVTLAVLYEVVARTVFGSPTSWGNETTIYLSAIDFSGFFDTIVSTPHQLTPTG